jgi:hypothetical protein
MTRRVSVSFTGFAGAVRWPGAQGARTGGYRGHRPGMWEGSRVGQINSQQ